MVHQCYDDVDNDDSVRTRLSSFETHTAYVCMDGVCVYVCVYPDHKTVLAH